MARLFLFFLLLLFMASLGLVLTPAVARPTRAPAPSSDAREEEDEKAAANYATPVAEGNWSTARHHRRSDRSIAGAEVILGGLATAALAAVVAYIRVTRKMESSQDCKA